MAPIIPGWSRDKLFNKAWVDALQPTVSAGQTATIRIFRVPLSEMEYDTWTGSYTYGNEIEELFAGPSRVQPLRVARNIAHNSADTVLQAVRFQINDMELDLRVGDRVRVTDSELNRSLETFEYIVQEIMDSSNPIEKTFEAFVDTEVRIDNREP